MTRKSGYTSTEVKPETKFPNIPSGAGSEIFTTLPFNKSDNGKQKSLLKDGGLGCEGPKVFGDPTYTYEAQDPIYGNDHTYYYFPVMCKDSERDVWVLKDYYAVDEGGSVEFVGYWDPEEYQFNGGKEDE